MTTGYFTEDSATQTVNDRMGPGTDPRLREIMAALVRHLHGFAREVQLRPEEWEQAIAFLTRTGQMCSAERQEFILLSDVLGLSMLVDAINNRRPEGATENTVQGPFHVPGAPQRAMGDTITLDGKGESCRFEGRVLDLEGQPVEGARIEVWADNADGFYDVQQPGIQPRWNNRGVFVTGGDGRYGFVGIKPVSYPIPDDGPVGGLLAALGRSAMRPAHTHFMIRAEGFQPLVTHTFAGDDPGLASDAVFGVKASLVAPFVPDPEGQARWLSRFDFVLAPL
jgi:catechol 1,2-dioxygenase